MRGSISLLIAFLSSGFAATAAAQTPPASRPGSVRVTVRDATRLPVPAAQVTLTGGGDIVFHATTNERGEAVFDNLPAGAYRGHVESAGFDALGIAEFSVRAGARVTRDVEVNIAAFADQLDVAPAADDQQLLNAFTSQLTDDQIAALPDDPDELAQLLEQLVGADAEIRVDGFAGGSSRPERRFRKSGSSTTPAPPMAAADRASRFGRSLAATGGATTRA
jgi:hypothetical protein